MQIINLLNCWKSSAIQGRTGESLFVDKLEYLSYKRTVISSIIKRASHVLLLSSKPAYLYNTQITHSGNTTLFETCAWNYAQKRTSNQLLIITKTWQERANVSFSLFSTHILGAKATFCTTSTSTSYEARIS